MLLTALVPKVRDFIMALEALMAYTPQIPIQKNHYKANGYHLPILTPKEPEGFPGDVRC